MFKKILVPVDGSDHSKHVLKAAAEFAKRFSGELVIVHVAEISPYRVMHDDITGWAAGYLNDTLRDLTGSAKKILESAKEQISGEFPNVKTRLEIGSPAAAICEAAQQEGCDLIIMGNRGVSDFKGFFLGSVSHQVLQRSGCPVLLIKHDGTHSSKQASK